MRDLAHGKDASIREHLANGLFHTLYHAKAENDLTRCDALLGELRALALALAHGEDAALRQHFANGLFNELHHAKAQGNLDRRDALLDELRELAENYSDDKAVQKVWRRAAEVMSVED